MRCFFCLIVFSLVLTARLVQGQTPRADSAASYLDRGNDWLARKELDRAITDYDLAIVFNPRSDAAYLNRGRAWELKGDLDRALTDYSRAIEINPQYGEAFYNRGIVQFARSEMKSAIADFTRAQPSSIPLGSYTAVFPEDIKSGNTTILLAGEYEVALLEGAKFRFVRNGFTAVSGTFAVTQDRIEFTDPLAAGPCNKGAYQWRLLGNKLSFAAAEPPDDCLARKTGLTTAAYFKSDPAAGVWKALGPEGGTVRAVLANDGKIFAGTDGAGILVSSDNGQSWRSTFGFRGYAVNALSAFNGNLFAGTNFGQIFVSTDGGQTWVFFRSVIGQATVQDFVEHNGKLYAATLGNGVFRVTDNPYLWEKAGATGLTNQNVFTLAAAGNNLFAGTNGGGVFVSTDGGNNWTAASNGLTLQRIRALAVSGNNLYAGTIGGTPGATPNEVFISEDNGQNWRRLGNGLAAGFPQNFTNQIYELVPLGDKLFAASTTGVIVHEGGNWRTVHQGLPVVSFFALAASGNQLFAGAWYDGVSRSLDGGANWSKINSGLGGRYTWSVFKDDGVLYAGVVDGAFRSLDDGRTWTRSNPAITVIYNFTAYDGKVYAAGGAGVYVTADQGQSWTRVNNGLTLTGGFVWRVIAANNALYACVYNNGVFHSTDGGQNWTAASNGLTSRLTQEITAIGNTLFVSTDDKGVLRSTDEGQNWAEVGSGLPPGVIYALAANGANLFAGVFGEGVFRSSDNGQRWTKANTGVVSPFLFTIYAGGGNLYAAGDGGGGVMRSTDDGQSWHLVNAGFDARFANGFFVDGGTLYAATPSGVYVSNSLVNQTATVSAASFSASAIAGKAIVAAFGQSLASGTAVASSLPLPTTLAGTTVKVRDSNGVERLAPLFFVSAGQVNYQIPAGTAAGPATVTIANSDGIGAMGVIQVRETAPAVFTANASGTGAAAAIDALTGVPPPFNATQANGQPNIIAVFGTGLGADATDVDGNVNTSVQARIDGNPVTVQYAGCVPGFTGLNQFNLVLPAGITSGTHTLTVARGGATSNSVTITIK